MADNTGYKAYANRMRSDGYIEPNNNSGIGPYFPNEIDLTFCPLPTTTTTTTTFVIGMFYFKLY